MEPQPTMDLLPITIFLVTCLVAAVIITFGIRRTMRKNKRSDLK
jgi:hypothetical protein